MTARPFPRPALLADIDAIARIHVHASKVETRPGYSLAEVRYRRELSARR